MTTTNDKLRSLFLSALMVMSVFAGATAFAGTAAAQYEQGDAETLTEGQRYWQGQTLYNGSLEGVGNDELLEIVTNDESEDLADQIYSDENGAVKFGTSGLSGSYTLQTADGQEIVNFSVASQDLTASWADDSVQNEFNTETTLTLNSKRAGYNATITADGLSSSELNDIFAGSDAQTENGVAFYNLRSDDLAADFDGVAPGNYTFEVEVEDTGATAEAQIEVTEGGDEGVSLGETIYEQRGDVAEFTVELENRDNAEVRIGSPEKNFKLNFTVNDNDEDGEVTVRFNTYNTTATTENRSTMVDAVGEDNVTFEANQSVYSGGDLSEGGLSNVIARGNYPVVAGLDYDQRDAKTALVINQRSTDEVNTWTHPDGSVPDEAATLLEGVSESDSIAMNDLAVVEVKASGLYGYVTADNFATEGVSLTVNQTNLGPNAGDNGFTSDAAERVFVDEENNTVFLVFDTNSGDVDISAGDEYNATFAIDAEANGVTTNDQSVSTEFSVEQRTVEFDNLNENDVLVLPNSENATISGTSNIAPGSQFDVEIESASQLWTNTVTVEDDGSFSSNFDLSEVENGTELTVSATGANVDASVDALVNENADQGEDGTETTETTDETETTTTEETETTTTEETETETETTTTTTETTTTEDGGDGGIPGFGVSVSLIALLAAALLALRRSN